MRAGMRELVTCPDLIFFGTIAIASGWFVNWLSGRYLAGEPYSADQTDDPTGESSKSSQPHSFGEYQWLATPSRVCTATAASIAMNAPIQKPSHLATYSVASCSFSFPQYGHTEPTTEISWPHFEHSIDVPL